VAASIEPGIDFVTDEMIDYEEPRQEGAYYFFLGFPQANLKINGRRNIVRCNTLSYGSIIYRGERGVWEIPDGGDYVDLDFDPSKTVDKQGRHVRTPHPRGISGCGIWRLHAAGVRAAEWSVDDIRLVAIEHRWNSQLHVLRDTMYCYINQLVANNYPDVAQKVYVAWQQRKRLRMQANRDADRASYSLSCKRNAQAIPSSRVRRILQRGASLEIFAPTTPAISTLNYE
jgi:hypothetical protein